MQKHYLFTKGWRTVIRILYAVLIGTFAIAGAGQMATAQAASATADSIPVKFELSVSPEKVAKICAQGKLSFYVGMDKTVIKEINGKDWNLPGNVPEPPFIEGSVTSGSGTLKKQLQDFDEPTAASVQFLFTAGKPGKVTLRFTTAIKNSWVGAKEEVIGSGVSVQKEITFTVIPCKYQLKTILKFPVPSLYKITVISNDATMKGDETGSFTGSATMAWAYSDINQEGCTTSISATDSQAELSGQLDEDGGQFKGTQTFQPTTVAVKVCCPIVGCRSASDQGSLDPLAFSVASAGGVVTRAATGQGVSGSATIVVIPEEDKAVAFNSDHLMAFDPSALQATLWEHFPWSYNTLQALHSLLPIERKDR